MLLETVWSGHRLELAAALAGVALLAAFELRAWAIAAGETPSEPAAATARARSLGLGFAFIGLVQVGLVLLARGSASGPALGLVGALAGGLLFGWLLHLARGLAKWRA